MNWDWLSFFTILGHEKSVCSDKSDGFDAYVWNMENLWFPGHLVKSKIACEPGNRIEELGKGLSKDYTTLIFQFVYPIFCHLMFSIKITTENELTRLKKTLV